jgi:hypothetical protein
MNRRRFIRTSAASSVGLLLAGTSSAFARTPKKVLVFGGTDFLGPAVVDALMADGHTVTIFNRGVTNAELFPRVEKLRGFRSGLVKSHEKRPNIDRYWPRCLRIFQPDSPSRRLKRERSSWANLCRS